MPVGVVPGGSDFPPVPSDTAGVGHSFGNDEDPLPAMRRADVRRGDVEDGAAVSGVLQSSKDNWKPALSERRDVLDDDECGSEFTDDPEVLEPEAGSFAAESGAATSERDVLTGESATDHVHG